MKCTPGPGGIIPVDTGAPRLVDGPTQLICILIFSCIAP